MSFLPIVERELRAAARKPSTYRARTRLVAATSGAAALLLLIGANQVTNTLFEVLAALAFFYCLIAGVRQASDCLSEEKREGTLGLLFLTDLRGYDVVLGKLAALLARSLQGVFAILPVLAIGLVLGGLTAGEFWRTAAVLTNTLFLSMCLALWVSSVSRVSHRSLIGAITLLVLLTTAPLLLERLLTEFWPAARGWIACLSPATGADLTSDLAFKSHRGQFWTSLLVNQFLGWVCLIAASWALPGSWQDRPVRQPPRGAAPDPVSPSVGLPAISPDPGAAPRIAFRRAVLDINPIYWLAARHDQACFLPHLFAAGAFIACALCLGLTWFLAGHTFGVLAGLSFAFALVLRLWVAWRSCATLAEARRTGAVELLLATPITVPEIIRGQWLALRRYFLWPLIATLLLVGLPALEPFLQQPATSNRLWLFPVPLITVFGLVTVVLDLVAAATVGMWLGLSEAKPVNAFAKTVLYVTIVPTLLFCIPNILFDLFWISWARRKLEHEFRNSSIETFTADPARTPWPLAPARPAWVPPVISR